MFSIFPETECKFNAQNPLKKNLRRDRHLIKKKKQNSRRCHVFYTKESFNVVRGQCSNRRNNKLNAEVSAQFVPVPLAVPTKTVFYHFPFAAKTFRQVYRFFTRLTNDQSVAVLDRKNVCPTLPISCLERWRFSNERCTSTRRLFFHSQQSEIGNRFSVFVVHILCVIQNNRNFYEISQLALEN